MCAAANAAAAAYQNISNYWQLFALFVSLFQRHYAADVVRILQPILWWPAN